MAVPLIWVAVMGARIAAPTIIRFIVEIIICPNLIMVAFLTLDQPFPLSLQ